MPGLDSTLLNQAYSIPLRLVHTFLQVTEQVWQPMHLSRLKTNANCARTFMGILLKIFNHGERGGQRGKSRKTCCFPVFPMRHVVNAFHLSERQCRPG